MKRLEGAFTLAEVLITLAIIGVIASITMPTLITNVQKQQVPPAIAKAINTLENANRLALTQNDARKLSEVPGDTYLNSLTSVSWREHDVPKTKKFHNLQIAMQNYSLRCNTTADGIQYCTKDNGTPRLGWNDLGNGMAMRNSDLRIYVDINGDKAPNEAGVDLFCLVVYDDDSSVLALGSQAYVDKSGSDTLSWKDGGCDGSTPKPKKPLSCTGSVVDNGYKVIY